MLNWVAHVVCEVCALENSCFFSDEVNKQYKVTSYMF